MNKSRRRIKARPGALKESFTLRQEFKNLVPELKAEGIRLDEQKIFVT